MKSHADELHAGVLHYALLLRYCSHEKLRNRVNLYRMKEQKEISPSTFAHLASSTLYEKR